MWFVPKSDTPKWLRRKIKRLPEATPIAAQFEATIVARNDRKKDVWYNSNASWAEDPFQLVRECHNLSFAAQCH